MNLVAVIYASSFIATALSAIPLYHLFYRFRPSYGKAEIMRAITTPPGVIVPIIAFGLGLGVVTLLVTTGMWLFRDRNTQGVYKKMYAIEKAESLDRLQYEYEEMKSNRHKRLEREIRALGGY